MLSQFSELKIILNDNLLTYYQNGVKNSDKTILFLHGWGAESTLWFQSASLVKNQKMLFLDLPGFGRSQNPPNPYSIDDYANTVDSFIKKLALKQIALIGHSFGGKTAIKLASNNPSYLNSLILVDASCFKHRDKKTSVIITLAKIVKPLFTPFFMNDIRNKLLRKLITEDVLFKPDLKETFAKVVTQDMEHDLYKIKKKTLIVWGEKDANTYTPLADAYRIHDIIKGSRLVTIPNAGHFCFLDEPKKFAQIIETSV